MRYLPYSITHVCFIWRLNSRGSDLDLSIILQTSKIGNEKAFALRVAVRKAPFLTVSLACPDLIFNAAIQLYHVFSFATNKFEFSHPASLGKG